MAPGIKIAIDKLRGSANTFGTSKDSSVWSEESSFVNPRDIKLKIEPSDVVPSPVDQTNEKPSDSAVKTSENALFVEQEDDYGV